MLYIQNTNLVKENQTSSSTSKPAEEKKVPKEKIFSYKKPIIEKTEVEGSLTSGQVKKKLTKNSEKFKNCFDEKNKEKVKIEFEIDKSGSVLKNTIKGKNKSTDKCVAKIIQEIKFPNPTREEPVKVRQTFGDPTVGNDGYAGLQNHFCRQRVLNFLIYARIKILEQLNDNYYRASLQSLEKIICEYSNQFPVKSKEEFILKTEEKIDPKKNCAYLPLARTWQVYDSKGLDNSISLWVWKVAPKSFFVEKLYQPPVFYKCN